MECRRVSTARSTTKPGLHRTLPTTGSTVEAIATRSHDHTVIPFLYRRAGSSLGVRVSHQLFDLGDGAMAGNVLSEVS